MALNYTHIILILLIGVFTGWGLFAVAIKYISFMKNTQIKMIEDIKTDIKHIKSEIKELK